MRYILLSADSPVKVYQVPNIVAENLNKYCVEFETWLRTSPDAEKYRTVYGTSFTETDFIEYLNTYIFPSEPSFFIEDLGWITKKKHLPEGYRKCPSYNF